MGAPSCPSSANPGGAAQSSSRPRSAANQRLAAKPPAETWAFFLARAKAMIFVLANAGAVTAELQPANVLPLLRSRALFLPAHCAVMQIPRQVPGSSPSPRRAARALLLPAVGF